MKCYSHVAEYCAHRSFCGDAILCHYQQKAIQSSDPDLGCVQLRQPEAVGNMECLLPVLAVGSAARGRSSPAEQAANVLLFHPLCQSVRNSGTGKYYEECLRFFNGLLELDAKGLLLGDALSFQLAIKSAYQVHDYRQVLSIYDRMVKSNLSASRPVVYIVSSVSTI